MTSGERLRGMTGRGLWLMLVLALAACGGRRSPTTDLSPLLEALGSPTAPVSDLAEVFVRSLDEPSRKAIEARAAQLSQQAGAPVNAAQVLQPRGLSNHMRVAAVAVEDETEAAATLVVQLVPLARAAADGELPGGAVETVRLPVRLEEGRWRLSLADLAALVGRVPLLAGATGER